MKLRLVAAIILAGAAGSALAQGFAPATSAAVLYGGDWAPLEAPQQAIAAEFPGSQIDTYGNGAQLLIEIQSRVARDLERQLERSLAREAVAEMLGELEVVSTY